MRIKRLAILALGVVAGAAGGLKAAWDLTRDVRPEELPPITMDDVLDFILELREWQP